MDINIKNIITKISVFLLISMMFFTHVTSSKNKVFNEDLDPLVNISVTVEIQSIRSLEKHDNHLNQREYIDRFSDPDFYVKVWINDELFQSVVWRNTRYLYDLDWSATLDVPDEEELVDIKIQLWDKEIGFDKICDISSDHDGGMDSYDVELTYSLKTGHWWGDDYTEANLLMADPSGYGRLNGCDDGSIYQHDRDCELWFDIYQTDADGDGLPYWIETATYNTDPEHDDTGDDSDGDGIPIEWEHKWGQYVYYDWHDDAYITEMLYDPNTYEDHRSLDPDDDGLDNYEEYSTSQWGSDPLRKDLYVEQDIIGPGPNGEIIEFPEESKEMLRTVYDRRNIVYHLDDGSMGGGEILPFDNSSSNQEIRDIYWNYFAHQDENNWRIGVFHYGLVLYNAERLPGFAFWGGVVDCIDSYQISSVGMEKQARHLNKPRPIVYASAYMHECGHTLGIFNGNTPGCDDQEGKYPWNLNWWKWLPYKSVMNYGYMYRILDYSDGSRGKNDFDDWNRIDFKYFQEEQ